MVAGEQIGAYRLLEQIGQGGMGTVYLAEHVKLGRRAAIKVLRPGAAADPDTVTRFFNEARAASAISDPGIVQVFDFGEHVDGSTYIVMEMLEGETLHDRLKRRGVLPIVDALRLTRQVASTLGAAHRRGIIHRDLKPANIFVVRDAEVAGGERAKILDFGIAKLRGVDASGMQTDSSAMLGTPIFMSPEQCRGAGHVDERSDIYSLGCVLYALVTGRVPFVATGIGEIIVMHMFEAPAAPSTLAPQLPLEVDRLILRCLAKEPAQRYASGGELAAALGELLSDPARVVTPAMGVPASPITANAPTLGTLATGAMLPASPTTISGSARWRAVAPEAPRSRRRLAIGLGAGVLVGGSALAVVALDRSGESAPAVAAAAAPEVPPDAHAPDAPPPPPDDTQLVKSRMRELLDGFVAWAATHPGAPCPQAAALDDQLRDPWGAPFALTCSDQPADQRVGVISGGPDRTLGTRDDVTSWTLGPDVTGVVRGPRWVGKSTTKIVRRPPRVKQPPEPPPVPPEKPPAPPDKCSTAPFFSKKLDPNCDGVIDKR